jgi:hypothetical protein
VGKRAALGRGERAYRWLNAGGWTRAHRGIHAARRAFPRSLAFCYSKLRSNLASLAREYGEEIHHILRNADSELHALTVDAIFDQGLHEFIGRFIAHNTQLALQIQRDYRFVREGSPVRIAIDHTTHYRFSEPAAHGLQRLRLTPKATSGQTIQSWDMELAGAVLEAEYDDHNCNHVSLIAFTPGATDVTIRCRGVVDTADNAGIVGKHSGHLPLWHFAEPTELTRAGPRVRALLAALGQARLRASRRAKSESESGHASGR